MKSVPALLCFFMILDGSARASADVPATSVELIETAQTVTLANGEVKLVFNKKKAVLESLTRAGRELLAKGGGYVQIAFTSRKDNPRVTWDFRIVRRTADLVEIAFVNTNRECPFDLAAHYILRAKEPGFHNYLAWGHDAARSPGVIRLGQYNLALRIDPVLFTTAAVDDQRIARFPKGEWLTPQRSVMDSTYRLPDGSMYSKYFFSAERDEKHTVHGAMGDKIGIWIIMPSHEHLNGGPEHQELTVHQGGASQVLLAHATAAHYGAGILTSDAKDGSWSKGLYAETDVALRVIHRHRLALIEPSFDLLSRVPQRSLILDSTQAVAGPVTGSPIAASAGEVVAVPEPGTVALLLAGLVVGYGVWRKRKNLGARS